MLKPRLCTLFRLHWGQRRGQRGEINNNLPLSGSEPATR